MEANKMCYVVECSSGSYEDHHTWIAGVFLDAIDAQRLKEKIENEIDVSKNTPPPFEEVDFDFLTEEQIEIYDKWWDENSNALEFNSVSVTEYPLK